MSDKMRILHKKQIILILVFKYFIVTCIILLFTVLYSPPKITLCAEQVTGIR